MLQKSSKHFMISIFFSPSSFLPPPPSKHFLISIFCSPSSSLHPLQKKEIKNEGPFLQSCSLKCVLPIFIIYKIALQNTDYGVLHNSSEHFILSTCGGGHPLPVPPPLGTSIAITYVLQFCS